MKLFNTLSNSLDDFEPMTSGHVKIYGCGPTVYNLMHVGNARMAVVFDAFRRYLQYAGFSVTYVQNFTDIDDKIINKAIEEGISWSDVSEKYIAEYFTDAHGLGVRDADVHPRATENIPEIIDLIQKLIDKGLAYESNGDVYYRTEKFPEYGKLSHQPMDQLLAGARIGVGESKENAADFALWKAAKPGEPSWNSPWGEGRPGWHIECSVMSAKYLGNTFDIHCGGADLIFPHHENEIAQSEGANGVTFARFWLHNGMITVNKEKMAKSKGNFFTVREAAAVYGYDVLRFFILSAQYRSQLDYSEEVLKQSAAALSRLRSARENAEFLSANGIESVSADEKAFMDSFDAYRSKFTSALEADFNTADALGVLFEFVREMNTVLGSDAPGKECAAASRGFIDEMNLIFGFALQVQPLKDGNSDSEDNKIDELVAKRQAAREAKDWALADKIRDELKVLGVTIEDTKQGVKIHKA